MRPPEDPTRDPASEARDDHASEPMATPETDAQGHGDGRHPYVPTEFARRLERQRDELTDRWEKSANAFLIEQGKREAAERQRDELLEVLYAIEERFVDGCDTYEDWQFMGQKARAAIAAVKGGQP